MLSCTAVGCLPVAQLDGELRASVHALVFMGCTVAGHQGVRVAAHVVPWLPDWLIDSLRAWCVQLLAPACNRRVISSSSCVCAWFCMCGSVCMVLYAWFCVRGSVCVVLCACMCRCVQLLHCAIAYGVSLHVNIYTCMSVRAKTLHRRFFCAIRPRSRLTVRTRGAWPLVL